MREGEERGHRERMTGVKGRKRGERLEERGRERVRGKREKRGRKERSKGEEGEEQRGE